MAEAATTWSMVTALLAGVVSSIGASAITELPSARVFELLEKLVVAVLFPLVASVLGYYFGRVREFSTRRSSDDEEAEFVDDPEKNVP